MVPADQTNELGNNWQWYPGGDHATDGAVPKIVKPDGAQTDGQLRKLCLAFNAHIPRSGFGFIG